MMKKYLLLILILSILSCKEKKSREITEIKNKDTLSVKNTTNFSDSNTVSDVEEPEIQEQSIYEQLADSSVFDGIPIEKIKEEQIGKIGKFRGFEEDGQKIGTLTKDNGVVYEGIINFETANWMPLMGNGKVRYPDSVIFIGNFGPSCDGTSWTTSGKLYAQNGSYFVGCLRVSERKLLTGTLYDGNGQEYTFIDGRKIPR